MVAGGRLEVEEVAGVAGTGVPLLNSVHRGHLQLVSAKWLSKGNISNCNTKFNLTYSYDPSGCNAHNAWLYPV